MSGQLNVAPTLLVSQLELRFTPADVGDERFLLLKIGQEGADTPLQVRIEGTDVFQIAVQASPLRFYSQFTLTPAPGGTFVHVRFAPRQAGQYTTELLIDTPYGTQPVILFGRTKGLLGRTLTPSTRRQRQTTLALPASTAQPAYEVPTGNPWLKTMALAVLLGGGCAMAYWWYGHRLGVPVSSGASPVQVTRSKPTPEPVQPAAVRPGNVPGRSLVSKPVSTESVPEENPALRAQTRRTRIVEPVAETPEPAVDEVATERTDPVPTPVRSNRRALAEPTSRPAKPTQADEVPPAVARPDVPASGERVTAEKTEKPKKRAAIPAPRPKPTDVPPSESDLERALNKNQ